MPRKSLNKLTQQQKELTKQMKASPGEDPSFWRVPPLPELPQSLRKRHSAPSLLDLPDWGTSSTGKPFWEVFVIPEDARTPEFYEAKRRFLEEMIQAVELMKHLQMMEMNDLNIPVPKLSKSSFDIDFNYLEFIRKTSLS